MSASEVDVRAGAAASFAAASTEHPATTTAELAATLHRARDAQRSWARLSLSERARVLRRTASLVLDRRHALSELVARETGKPPVEALVADVGPVLDAIQFVTSRRAGRVLEPRLRRLTNPLLLDRRSRVVREPVGVVGIIAPWNIPLGIAGTELVFTLAAGNAAIVKPSSRTPFSIRHLAEYLYEAGLPPGLVSVVTGRGAEIGEAMARADFDHLIYTGSTPAGARVAAARASRGGSLTLELGGSDPAIVLADADLDRAANGVVYSRFIGSGQTCCAVKRVYVEQAVAERFVELVVAKTSKLRMGVPEPDLGPLIDERAVDRMQAVVADAVEHGARVLTGGRRGGALARSYFEPSILVDATADARVLREEVFGPILPVSVVKDAAEAVQLANASPYGLSASVWSRNLKQARDIAAQLQAGSVWINDHGYTWGTTDAPWGGVKGSGHGRTHGVEGLLAVTRPKYVNESPARTLLPDLWWFPYDRNTRAGYDAVIVFLYGGWSKRVTSLLRLLRAAARKRLL